MKGTTRFSDKALTKIVHAAATSVPGVMTVTTSWTQFASRNYPRSDLRADHDLQTLDVSLYLAVSWPTPATAVASHVQTTVSQWVKEATGLRCSHVNVTIEHFAASERAITLEELAVAPTRPVLAMPQLPQPPTLRQLPQPQPHRVYHPVTPTPPSLSMITTRPQPALRRVRMPSPPVVRSPRVPYAEAPRQIYVKGAPFVMRKEGRRVR